MAVVLESISAQVTPESAEALGIRLQLDHLTTPDYPALEIGRVSIVHSLDKLAEMGSFLPSDIIGITTAGKVSMRGALSLVSSGRTLYAPNAEMTLSRNSHRSIMYYILTGTPCLEVRSE